VQLTCSLPPEIINCNPYFLYQLQLTNRGGSGNFNCKKPFEERTQLTRSLPPEKINCNPYFLYQLQLTSRGGSKKFNCNRTFKEQITVNAPPATAIY